MATWEDGPEYAPIERPTGFDLPDVAPLQGAPPVEHPSAGAPPTPPQFRPAPDPGPPLTAIAPGPEEVRDPHEPFAVSQATMTSQTSAWAGAHWSRREGAAAPPGPDAVDPTWGPPPDPGAPAAAPQFPPPTGPPAPQGAFPAPGSVEWFGPPPQAPDPGPREAPISVAEGLTPGYMVVLLACLVYPFAPIFLIIGLLLSRRVKIAQQVIPKIAAGAGILWGLIALINLLGAQSFGDWWWGIALWAMIIGLILLIVSGIVAKVLPDHTAPPGPPPPWG